MNTDSPKGKKMIQGIRLSGLCSAAILGFSLSLPAQAALNENCIISVLNRTVQVKPDGTWVLPNIPANSGPVRARATCVQNGLTTSGQSDFFTVPVNGSLDVPPVVIGPVTPIPTSVTISSGNVRLTQPGQSTQLAVAARYADSSTKDVTANGTGTQYLVSNPALASITSNGLVTALTSGTVIVQAINEGTQGLIQINNVLSVDTDGDGIPDDVELRNGMDPNNPGDALDDPDHDGLTNLEEYQRGTNIRNADTDGDSISDGDEVKGTLGFFTNPLLADTDGDGIPDKVEIAVGTDPTNAASRNLAGTLKTFKVTPTNPVINVNSIIGVGYVQMTVTGEFTLGGTIDLTTPASGTNYNSSDLQMCNFGAEAGRVYGGSTGTCTLTISNSGYTASVQIPVNFFVPTALSYIAIPGFANNVDVAGNYAYVAAGSTGLQIVDVSDRRNPRIVGALDTAGNANDVRVVDNLAYVADGSTGLQIIDVTVPATPVKLGNYNTPGDAYDVVISGNRAYVADGAAGLQIINITNPALPTLLGTYDSPGIAKGVDVSGNIAVLADGASGVRFIDVSDPTRPLSVGNLATSDARDVSVEGTIAYVADYTGSLKIIDFTNPASPSLRANTAQPLGGILTDVAKVGRFTFGADVYFVNGVPIINVTDPANPIAKARLDFPARDDNATGIAVDGQYIYLTAERGITENGTTGDTRLYIGQYLIAEDKAGIAPTVSIVSPLSGETFVEGARIPVTVNASDDVQVVGVTLSVNNEILATDNTPPYQFVYTVPTGSPNLILSATAVDLGSNVGVSNEVSISIIPDPLTTVTGRVIDSKGQLVAGASVSTIGGRSSTTAVDGTFSILDVPTALERVQVNATAVISGVQETGVSANVPAVRGGVSNVGDITVHTCALKPTGLVSWWPGEGNANDIIGTNHGILQNGTTFGIGEVGQAFSLDGINNYIQIPDSQNLNPNTNDFTVAFWMKTTTTGISRALINKRPVCNHTSFWDIRISTLGYLQVEFDQSGSYYQAYASSISIDDGNWHHVTLVRQGTITNLYIDGQIRGSGSSGIANISSSAPIQLGNDVCVNRDGTKPYAGFLDEVIYLNGGLSQTQVQDIYNAGNTGMCK